MNDCLEKELSHFFSKSMTPEMQKMSTKLKFSKNFFFSGNNFKEAKLCQQRHLKSFGLVSGLYFSKQCLAISPKNL